MRSKEFVWALRRTAEQIGRPICARYVIELGRSGVEVFQLDPGVGYDPLEGTYLYVPSRYGHEALIGLQPRPISAAKAAKLAARLLQEARWACGLPTMGHPDYAEILDGGDKLVPIVKEAEMTEEELERCVRAAGIGI